MTQRHETLVVALRQELGIQGCPGIAGTHRLVASLPWLYFHHDPDPERARTVTWFDGSSDIWAPEDDPYLIVHELSHALRDSAVLLCMSEATVRLKATDTFNEESGCHGFARAFLLPPLEVWSHNGDLAAVSGCPPPVILTRRREISDW